MARRDSELLTIRSEGGLLPPDLLRRILDPAGKLDGTLPRDYGLPEGERLSEVITQSWNRLRKHWAEFRAALAGLAEGEAGTGLTNDKLSLPLLRELGFGLLPSTSGPELNGRTYAISRFFGPVPIHLVGAGLSLDRKAAGQRGAATSNPHGLVQEFLNRSPGHLWAIVGNGLRLRVLRDNQALSRQSFLEFDLAAMFDGEVYSDFVLLWLVAHATRFTPRDGDRPDSCWLEEWTREAQSQGTRALGELRGGVERALQILGEGFTGHPKNTKLRDALRSGAVPLADFHGQLLRVVYRLIFLFVAEDRVLEGRSLLHPPDASEAAKTARQRFADHYGTARLRHLAGTIRGSRHGDLWRQFQVLVGALSGEADFQIVRESIALPALGSFLWSPHSTEALNGAELTNYDVLEALRHLSFTRHERALRPVDYRNLGAEELGGVYESLLALTPQISADGARFTFAEFAGNERKTSGSYYTPETLVKRLLDSALDPVVEQCLKGKSADEAEAAILELRVCDPAAGSGHFLVGVAHRLARHLARVRAQALGEGEPSPPMYQHALRDVIGRCVYGVDINPMAAELCRVSLWLEALEPGRPLSFLDHHVRVGNSLVGATPELVARLVPDEAFGPLDDDDKAICTSLKRRNKQEREGGQGDFYAQMQEGAQPSSDDWSSWLKEIDAIPDATLADVRRKAERHATWEASPEYVRARLVADTWCAAFLWRKVPETGADVVTSDVVAKLRAQTGALTRVQAGEIAALASRYKVFHWHLAFPEVVARGGFDVIVGNPPYLNAIEQKTSGLLRVKGLWTSRFHSARGAYDLYVLFIELARDLLRRSGRAALLTPNKYLAAPYAEALREYLARAACLVEVIDVSKTEQFSDASVYPIISTLSGTPSDEQHIVSRLPRNRSEELDVVMHERSFLDSLPDHNWGVLLSRGAGLVGRIHRAATTLGELMEVCASTTAAEADEMTQAIGDEGDGQVANGWRALNTGLIEPFHCLWGVEPMRHNKQVFRRPVLRRAHNAVPERRAKQYASPKIIFAKLAARTEAFFDARGEYAALNVNFAFTGGREGYFYLAQLNSLLSTWLYRQLFGALSMGGDYMQFQAPQLRSMLVVPFDAANPLHTELAELGSRAQSDPTDAAILSGIDSMVARIVGVSSEEMETIIRSAPGA